MHHPLRSLLVVALSAGVLSACSSNNNTTPGGGPPASTTVYGQSNTIAIPGVPPATGTFSFDISYVDSGARQYYLADRTTDGVDVIDMNALAYVRTAGKGAFAGTGTPGPGGSPATNGGPNGVVPVGNGIVFAGDGDSTMKVVNANTGALLATIPAPNPTTGTISFCGAATTGKANQRMDEMAYDPTDNIVIGINDASCPPFATFFNANAPYNVVGSLPLATANSGAEQPVWDPAQGKFLLALPSTIANPGGEVDVIDPKSFKVTSTYAIGDNCGPAGNAIGQNEIELLGCAGPDLIFINATNGNQVAVVPGMGGCDEVWYNPRDNRFYAGCSNNTGGARLVVMEGNGSLVTYINTSAGAHSVAVDANTNTVVYPQRALGVTTYNHP